MADEKEQQPYKNPLCSWAPEESDHCSASCEGNVGPVVIDCDCSHQECQGNF
jgi:hypothetical protein